MSPLSDGFYHENAVRPAPRRSSTIVMAIPDGCTALWHADISNVDPAYITAQAGLAARRTHTNQAVVYADGTVAVINGD